MSLYSDLVADAAAILRGPDISDLLLIYAKQAIRDVQKNSIGPIYENSTSANVTIAAAALQGTLPTNFGRSISAIVSGEELPLEERHARVFLELGWPDNSDNFTDAPTEFAQFGSLVILNGQFSEAKTLVMRYAPWQPAPVAASETFPYSEKMYDVVLSRMVQLGFIDQRDDIGKADWERLYSQRLNEYLGVSSRVQDASRISKTMISGR